MAAGPSNPAQCSPSARCPGVEMTKAGEPSFAVSGARPSSAPARNTTREGRDSWMKRSVTGVVAARRPRELPGVAAPRWSRSDVDRVVQALQQRVALIPELRRDDELA